MCIEKSADEFEICDVALPDVRAAVDGLSDVTIVHRPYQPTLVVNGDPDATDTFAPSVRDAIAKQAG